MRVLVTSVPGWGHINPMVPLAQAFLDCGDDVVVASGRDACDGLEAAGLKVAPCGLTQKEGMADFHRRFSRVRRAGGGRLPGCAQRHQVIRCAAPA